MSALYTVEGCPCGGWYVVPPGRRAPWFHVYGAREHADRLAETWNRGEVVSEPDNEDVFFRKLNAKEIRRLNNVLARARGDVETLRTALERTLELAEKWADGVGRSHPDHEVTAEARAALAKVKR